jgi:methionine synthase II (cobalamin-independent)
MLEKIAPETLIEDLVHEYPEAVAFLMERGIRCVRCGEPLWGTLASAMEEKNLSSDRQLDIVQELRHYLHEQRNGQNAV